MIPHSCGDNCGKKRGQNCTHPCDILCHPGPCPPCSLRGEPIRCYCNKQKREILCSDGTTAFECGATCGRKLNCGNHTCKKSCVRRFKTNCCFFQACFGVCIWNNGFIFLSSIQVIVENALKSWKLSVFVQKKINLLSVGSIYSLAINLATRPSHVVITSAFRHAIQGT